jgi:hypothetical protein
MRIWPRRPVKRAVFFAAGSSIVPITIVSPQWDRRYSFCCAEEDCRRRRTPESLRFLGRRVYAGLVVVLVTVMIHGLKPGRVRRIREAMQIDSRTVLVLDDQLVQSDDNRMDWFRGLLAEKAHSFQIVVFTCRPGDYLLASALVPEGSVFHADTDGGFIRAVDLGRALRRR